MDKVPLPPDIVKRFDNKPIAIMGYEEDQVFANETSVPINWAYNHHYVFWMQGKNSEMVLTKASPNEHEYWMRGDGSKWQSQTIKNDPDPNSTIPTSHIFAEGNGGEMRKSFHGYGKGVAQLIESPVTFQIDPMQIDTHRRDRPDPLAPYEAGPLPKAALSPPGAVYSGLLECPCSDRRYKDINKTVATRVAGTCGAKALWNSTDCFDSAAAMLGGAPASTQTGSDAAKPAGCSFTGGGTHPGDAHVFFNELKTATAPCGGGGKTASGTLVDSTTGVTLVLKLDASGTGVATMTLSGPATAWFAMGFNATEMGDLPYTIVVSADATGATQVVERKLANHAPGEVLSPPTVKVVSSGVSNGVRTVTLTRAMKGADADHYSFSLGDGSIPVISAAGNDQTFGYHKVRNSATLSLVASGAGAVTCLCAEGITGSICGNAVGGCLAFGDTGGQDLRGARCPAAPLSQLAAQRNPTCTVQQYSGGLRCCHHKNVLLDKDQDAESWPNDFMTYRIKVRFWFQEYSPPSVNPPRPASHQNLVRFYWQTESFAGEYDVPSGPDDPTGPGTSVDPKTGGYIHTITSKWKVEDMVWGCNPRESSDHCTGGKNAEGRTPTGIELRYAGGHCHAPSCLSIELYNADTMELLCAQLPVYGEGNTHADKFDEKGYVALPPCLWGGADEGLAPPVPLKYSTNLLSVKRNNATVGHYGEMASWQMRGIMLYD